MKLPNDIRDALLARRERLSAELDVITARLEEIDMILAAEAPETPTLDRDPPQGYLGAGTITRARNPRTIKKDKAS